MSERNGRSDREPDDQPGEQPGERSGKQPGERSVERSVDGHAAANGTGRAGAGEPAAGASGSAGAEPVGPDASDDELGSRLHTALLSAADDVEPRPDALTRIRARTGAFERQRSSGWTRFRTRWLTNPAVAALGSTAVVLAGAVVVVGASHLTGHPVAIPVLNGKTSDHTSSRSVASRSPNPPRPSKGGADPTSTDQPSRHHVVTKHVAVPVYTVSRTSEGYAVTRTSQEITVRGTKAQRHHARTEAALDAVFSSDAGVWPSGTRVEDSRLDGSTLVVALNSAGGASTGASNEGAAAQAALKQLVLTGLDATPGATAVQVTVGGAGVSKFRDALPVDGALTRGSTALTRSLNSLGSPSDGATVSSPVPVSGTGSYDGGRVRVHVTDGNGTVVSDQTEDVGSGFTDWSTSLTLDPGTYTVETSPADGTPGTNTATATFTVSG